MCNAEEQQKVYKYLDDSPKDVKKVVEAMEQKTRKRVSTKTLKRLRACSHLSGQVSSRARCEVAIRFNMFHRPAL